MYAVDYASFTSIEDITKAIININKKTIACQQWTYDSSVYPRTIITDVSSHTKP
jgi:hypothetical protein